MEPDSEGAELFERFRERFVPHIDFRGTVESEDAADRLIVDDADAALPEVFKALEGAELRFAAVVAPSFDGVFLCLVRG